jgi:hypothetical protein
MPLAAQYMDSVAGFVDSVVGYVERSLLPIASSQIV